MPNQDDLTEPPGTPETQRPEAEQVPPHPARLTMAQLLRTRAARDDIALRRRVILKLRAALADGGFVLHYQPKLDLKTGRPRGAEAMIRLQHRRRGLILPAHFMPVAERSDLINEIGAWALRTACQEAARWPAGFGLSLNVSHRQLRGGQLTKQVIEALGQSGLAAERLELELSEAMLIDDHEDTGFSVKAARALGVGVALDDFGAGYGSLSVLRRMPLTALKLDRSVIVGLRHDRDDTAILRAAIDAAHALGCKVIADGVETEAQSNVLRQLGCDEAQGSYFSAALPAEELRVMLGVD